MRATNPLPLALLWAAAALAYLAWRVTVFNPDAPVFSGVFFALEALGVVWAGIFVFSNLKLARRRVPPAPVGLTVDVFVPSVDEPVALLRRTLKAALAIRYAHQTWLLDDGNRPTMRALAESLGCRYLARGTRSDAKAGNLNHALAHSEADFIAIFDADHVALPEFLDRTLGYFREADVALVQTPQEFLNSDAYSHYGADRHATQWNEHSLFYRLIQRGRDAVGAAMFCGCAAVLRRAALDDTGGFATGTVTEDMHTSLCLHARGWQSVYHPQTLSAGLAPADAWRFSRQRRRWAQGALQVFRVEKLWWRPDLGAARWLAYLVHVGAHLEGPRGLLMWFAPPLALISGVAPIACDLGDYALAFAPVFALSTLLYARLGRGHGRLFRSEVFNLARGPASLAAIAALFRRRIEFWVTPKTPSRDPAHSRLVLPWLVLAADGVGIGIGAWRYAHGLGGAGGALAVVMLWTLAGLVIALALLRHARRCAATAGEEPAIHLGVAAWLQISESQQGEVRLKSATADRVWLDLPATAGQQASLSLTLEGEPQRLALVGSDKGWMLQWPNDEARERWDGALHQARIRALARLDGANETEWAEKPAAVEGGFHTGTAIELTPALSAGHEREHSI